MPERSQRILIVRAGALGDTLMTTPLVRALRDRQPDAEIDYVCSLPAVPLLATNPHLSRLYPLRWRNLPAAISSEKKRIRRELRGARYDLAILLETNRRYEALLAGSDPGRVLRASERPRPELHMVAQNLWSGGIEPETASHDMELLLSPADRKRSEVLLGGLGSHVVAFHAGYGPSGRARKKRQSERLKGWASDNFARVAKHLLGRDMRIVLTGTSEDRPAANAIEELVGSECMRNLCGRTTARELGAVIERCQLVVSVDTASAHIAAAVGTPAVVLIGPGNPDRTAPVSSATPICVVRRPPWCAPCFGTPRKDACRQNICMEAITPEEVIDKVEYLLADHPEGVDC